MPVLLALSILAFVALLWATISIAGFVRRARRRRRRRVADAAEPKLSGATQEPAEPPAVFYRDPEAAEALAVPLTSDAVLTEPVIARKLVVASDVVPVVPLKMTRPERFETPASESIASELPSAEALPPPPLPPQPAAEPPPAPRLRSFPTRLGKHTMTLAAADDSPTKWNPFAANQDFADLSDPTASRHFPSPRIRNKDSKH